jgi:excisionase family DNA binding protein
MAAAGPEQEQEVPGGRAGERYYTVAEAARTLRVHRTTILRWIVAGRLRAYRVGPKSVRIMESDLGAAVTPANGKRGEVTDAVEQKRSGSAIVAGAASLRLTDGEIERGLASLRRLRASRGVIAARHAGPVLPTSEELVRQEREARSERL